MLHGKSIFSPDAVTTTTPEKSEKQKKKKQTRDTSERRALIERRGRATREINIALNQRAEKCERGTDISN